MKPATTEKCEQVQALIAKGSSENKALDKVGIAYTTFRTWKETAPKAAGKKITFNVPTKMTDSVTLIVCRPTQVSDILKQLS